MDGTCGSGIVSRLRGVGGLCEMCIYLARGSI